MRAPSISRPAYAAAVGVNVTKAIPPKKAKSPVPVQGARWRCPVCGRHWPAYQLPNGNLTHSPECAEDGCRECRSVTTAYDPTKPLGAPPKPKRGGVPKHRMRPGEPSGDNVWTAPHGNYNDSEYTTTSRGVGVGAINFALGDDSGHLKAGAVLELGGRPPMKPGEYAIEFQLKYKNMVTPPTPNNTFDVTTGVGQYTANVTLNGYRAFHDGTYELDEPQGRVVRDRESYDRVVMLLTQEEWFDTPVQQLNVVARTHKRVSRPRHYLKVFDHLGRAIKFESLDALWPKVDPSAPIKPDADLGPTPLTATERIAVLRVLTKTAPHDSGMFVDVEPTSELLEAFERRREAFRKDGRPTEVTTLWHGTCAHNIPSILKEGLRLARYGGGALGPGIYLGLQPKAVCFSKPCACLTAKMIDASTLPVITSSERQVLKRKDALLRMRVGVEVDVLLGKTFVLDGDGPVPQAEGPRRALGRGDSIWCSRFKQDEWCVFRRDQVLVKKVVVFADHFS